MIKDISMINSWNNNAKSFDNSLKHHLENLLNKAEKERMLGVAKELHDALLNTEIVQFQEFK